MGTVSSIRLDGKVDDGDVHMSEDKLLDASTSCIGNEEPSPKQEDTDSFKLYGCGIKRNCNYVLVWHMLSIIFNERGNNRLLPQSLTDPTQIVYSFA